MTDSTAKPASRWRTVPSTDRTPWALILLLVAVAGMGPFSMQMIVPALPMLAGHFERSISAVQLTVSLYLIGLACSQLIVGPLSDRFGRRPVLIGGLTLVGIANLAAIFAVTLEPLIVARGIQALGAAAGVALSRAIIRDLYDRDRAAGMIGLVVGVMMVAPMVGPLIGGLLETSFGWRTIFYLLGTLSILIAIWAVATLPETRRVQADGRPRNWRDDIRALMHSTEYHGYILCVMFAAATFFIFAGGGAYVTVLQMGRSSAEYGAWFATGGLAYVLGNLSSARLSPQLGVYRMIWIGLTLQMIGSLINLAWGIVGLNQMPSWLFLTQTIVAYGNGFVMSNASAGAVSVRPQAAGTASGIQGFLQMGFGAIVSQIGAYLGAYFSTPLPLNIGGVVLTFACTAVVMFLIPKPGKKAAG